MRACFRFSLTSFICLLTEPQSQAESISWIHEAYVRAEAPPFEIPPYEGERYDDLTPDTLDLAEMAEWAVNGLTRVHHFSNGIELYFVTNWFHNPPAMYHDFSAGCKSKFMGPLVLNRIISGSRQNLDIEQAMIELYLRGIDDNGLFHQPLRGRPWRRHGWDMYTWGETDKLTMEQALEDGARDPPHGGGGINARLIEAVLLYHLRDGNPMWLETVRKMVHNGTKSMVDKGEWGYFGSPEVVPTGFSVADGWKPQALMQYYRRTGDEHAREVARKHLNFLKDHANYFDAEGRFIGDTGFFPVERAKRGGHFHAHTNILLAMLEYWRATGDTHFLDFARKSFDWAKSKETYSSSTMGFFPEFIGPDHPNSEGCPVADMVALALMLAEGGAGDAYWDDADRWLRNYFTENQLSPTRAADLERFARSQPTIEIPYNATAEDVTERNIGAFAGWPGPNEWAHKIGIQHCCTGNGTRSIYYAWENILHFRDGEMRINLLLNRASRQADIHSFIPYEGRVDVKAKVDLGRLLIRAPEWIPAGSHEVHCTVDDAPREFSWENRYVDLGPVSRGQRASVTFPIGERAVTERIAGTDYTMLIKGNTIVAIDPPGRNSPLFQREHYRKDKARWREVSRFVSDEDIRW